MSARSFLPLVLVLAFSAATASAGDWEHRLTPYAWAVGQEGDTGVRNMAGGDLITSYDLSPGDILDRLDGAFLLAYRGETNERWGVIVDTVYMDLVDRGTLSIFDIKIDASQLLISAAYTRAFRQASPWWWFAGVRYADVENKIRFLGSGPVGVGATIEPGDSWFDPLVGVSYRRALSQRWTLGLTAEAGGFGVGSDRTYQAMAEAGFDINALLRLRFGYRWLEVDYDDGFVFDAVSDGALVGLTFSW